MNASIPTVRSVTPAGHWSGDPLDTITLDFDQRYRRRILLTSDNGHSFLLDLADTTLLNDGDGLALGDGAGLIAVVAAPEELAEIRPSDGVTLSALAWHLGNRHLPVEIADGALRIRRNPVVEAFIEKIGGDLAEIRAPFNPISASSGH